MTIARILRTLTISLLFCALPLAAEQLEFRRAVELALKHSGTMMAATADRARAAERYRAERYAYIPQVYFGSDLGYSFGQPIAIAGQAPSIFNLTHTQTLLNFSTMDSIKAAHSDSIAANLDYADRAEQVILDTALLYIELDNTRQRLDRAEAQKKITGEVLFIAQQREQEGVGAAIDVKRAELEVARVELSIAELESSADQLRERLAHSTGLSPATLETVADSIPAPPPTLAEEDLASLALANSVSVRVADEHVRAAHDRARAEHRMKYPSIDFAGQYAEFASFNNYGTYYKQFSPHNYSFGVNIRVPLFNVAQNARAAAADAEAMHAEADAQTLRDQVATDAVRAQHALRELQARAKVARLEYEVAEANIDAVRLRILNGNASILDRESARADVEARQLLLLQSQFEYLRAQLQLLRQTGELHAWALGAK